MSSRLLNPDLFSCPSAMAVLAFALVAFATPSRAATGPEPPLTPRTLQIELARKQSPADSEKLASQIRQWFGERRLANGAPAKVNGLDVAWAIEAPAAKDTPLVLSETDNFTLPLTRVGNTDLYAGARTLPDGAGMRWTYDVDGRHTGGGQLEVYSVDPDSRVQPGVPHGTLTQQPRWTSNIFAGTGRDWWVYVPAEYKPDQPAAVMIFQDGSAYTGFVPTVFDNLIARGEMPVTVGIFLNPGTFEDGRSDRSFEYDTLSDQYARFLLEEILPEVEKTIKLRQDAAGRAVAGLSSGGICAWTVAWQRPDEFSKVLSWIGSFTNIASGPSRQAGGHNYEALIRKTPPKPIRIFLQDGANDLDNDNGNWPLASQQMAKALAFAHYDYKFVFGHGFHSPAHGRAILPDALRWLWR